MCVTLTPTQHLKKKKKKKLQLCYSQSAFTFIQYKKNVNFVDGNDIESLGDDIVRSLNSVCCMPIGQAVHRIQRGKEK